jgi:hypothetical protein
VKIDGNCHVFANNHMGSYALSPIGWWPHFLEFFSSHPVDKNICPAVISFLGISQLLPIAVKKCPEAIQ